MLYKMHRCTLNLLFCIFLVKYIINYWVAPLNHELERIVLKIPEWDLSWSDAIQACMTGHIHEEWKVMNLYFMEVKQCKPQWALVQDGVSKRGTVQRHNIMAIDIRRMNEMAGVSAEYWINGLFKLQKDGIKAIRGYSTWGKHNLWQPRILKTAWEHRFVSLWQNRAKQEMLQAAVWCSIHFLTDVCRQS